jgi:hypothetical protein
MLAAGETNFDPPPPSFAPLPQAPQEKITLGGGTSLEIEKKTLLGKYLHKKMSPSTLIIIFYR